MPVGISLNKFWHKLIAVSPIGEIGAWNLHGASRPKLPSAGSAEAQVRSCEGINFCVLCERHYFDTSVNSESIHGQGHPTRRAATCGEYPISSHGLKKCFFREQEMTLRVQESQIAPSSRSKSSVGWQPSSLGNDIKSPRSKYLRVVCQRVLIHVGFYIASDLGSDDRGPCANCPSNITIPHLRILRHLIAMGVERHGSWRAFS